MSDIPFSQDTIQAEGLTEGAPVSSATWQAMGGAVNFLLASVLPVGSTVESMLDEATFQSQTSTNWILADGRSVSGSRYQDLTGHANVPDLRSVYTRGKDNGRGLNPDGDLPLGSYQSDQIASHVHGNIPYIWTDFAGNHGDDDIGNRYVHSGLTNSAATGGNETRVKSVTMNKFIRIN